MQQHPRQTQSLCLTTAERIGKRLPLEIQVDDLQHLVALLPPRGTFDAISGRKKFEILDDFHVVIDTKKVWHIPHQSPDLTRLVVDRMVADIRLTV